MYGKVVRRDRPWERVPRDKHLAAHHKRMHDKIKNTRLVLKRLIAAAAYSDSAVWDSSMNIECLVNGFLLLVRTP